MSQSSDGVSRRNLLTHGTALAGAGVALAATASQAAAAGAGAGEDTPNLNPPVVQIRAGNIRGFRDGPTLTFLGVPYAQAERFAPPQPVTPWIDIKSTQTWGPVCPIPQQTSVGIDDFVFPHRYWVENENCQVLNVWTQNLTPSVKKPVMVWMHGGGFTNGSAMESYAYDGKSLSEYGDVVVVSVNHRLNIIGTLDLSAYGAAYADSRNTGMADLVASLQWVRDNIETFGGDPANVTIFGQSGGGGKVTTLLHMPAAQGLFHKVIAQSSSLVDYRGTDPARTIQEQQMIAAETLANLKLGAADMDRLKAVPYRDLLAAGTAALKTVGTRLGHNMNWGPVADDRNVMRELCDWAHAIPYIAGNVLSEFNSNLRAINDQKNDWSAAEVDRRLTTALGAKKDETVAEFRKLQPRKKIQDILFTDNRFRHWTKVMLAQKLEKATAPVYSYMFSYEYPVNGGVTPFHTSEIAFVFHALSEPHIKIATGAAAAGLALQELVSTAWLNFARTGNPSQAALAWQPYSVASRETMVFDAASAMRPYNDDRLQELLPATPPPRPG